MRTYAKGPNGSARWIKAWWLTPCWLTSWVPLPGTVISRLEYTDCGRLHVLHELAHVWQIDRDGYWPTFIKAVRAMFKRKANRPLEIEARNLASQWWDKEAV